MRVLGLNEAPCDDPTAHASVADTADTPFRLAEVEPDGVGVATTLHAVPFQCSASGAAVWPTAHTSFVATPSMPYRKLPLEPTLGLGTTFQAVPFQCWVSVWYTLFDRKKPADHAS